MPLSKKVRNGALLFGKMVLTAVVMYFVLRKIDFGLMAKAFLRIEPIIFLTALATQFLVQVFQSIRWKVLALESKLSLKEFFAFTCLSNAMLLISPGAIVSDSINAYFMGRRHQMMERALTSVVLGRIFGMAAMAFFFFTFLPFNWRYIESALAGSRYGVSFGALAAIFGIVALLLVAKRMKILRKYRLHLKLVASSRKTLIQAFVLSLAVQASMFAIAYQGYLSMDVPIGLHNLLCFGPLINLIGLVPVTIGQVGVREGVNILFFTLIPGVTREEVLATVAFAYCIGISATILNLALAWLFLRKTAPVGVRS